MTATTRRRESAVGESVAVVVHRYESVAGVGQCAVCGPQGITDWPCPILRQTRAAGEAADA